MEGSRVTITSLLFRILFLGVPLDLMMETSKPLWDVMMDTSKPLRAFTFTILSLPLGSPI